ncbi:hypothetical protein STEG23_002994 [Scotinomys teguina]
MQKRLGFFLKHYVWKCLMNESPKRKASERTGVTMNMNRAGNSLRKWMSEFKMSLWSIDNKFKIPGAIPSAFFYSNTSRVGEADPSVVPGLYSYSVTLEHWGSAAARQESSQWGSRPTHDFALLPQNPFSADCCSSQGLWRDPGGKPKSPPIGTDPVAYPLHRIGFLIIKYSMMMSKHVSGRQRVEGAFGEDIDLSKTAMLLTVCERSLGGDVELLDSPTFGRLKERKQPTILEMTWEFEKLKYVHHTIDTYSGFQWAIDLISERADSVITHLLEVMAIMGIPAQIKTDNATAYVSVRRLIDLLVVLTGDRQGMTIYGTKVVQATGINMREHCKSYNEESFIFQTPQARKQIR